MLLRLHTPVSGAVWTALFRFVYRNAWRLLSVEGGFRWRHGFCFSDPSISTTYFLGPWQKGPAL